jgi:hypothetical protein
MKNSEDQIWRYLHNELPPEDRQHFERTAAEDPDLQQELEECRIMHQNLEYLGDHQLQETLLAEWESEHPQYRETENKKEFRSRIIRLSIPLAAAAALVLLLANPLHQGPVDWERTVYGPAPQLRGPSEAQPIFSRADLKQVNRDLRRVVEKHLVDSARKNWKLQIQFQEFADGYLLIEVSGHPKGNPERDLQWDRTFQGKVHLQNKVAEFAKLIADDLLKYNTL